MSKLSLALIMKNEEKNIPRLMESINGIFDEIIFVDTGSTDNSKPIASNYGKIYDFKWIDDFSAARNYAFSKTTLEYVMWLDLDDILLPEDKQKLLNLKKDLSQGDIYLMPYNYAQDETGKCQVQIYRHRIIKRGTAVWQYPIHECMRFVDGVKEIKTDVIITHKRTALDVSRDIGRNIKILKTAVKQNSDDQRLKYYYAKELYSEGQIEESIKAFEKYFDNCTDWHDNQVNAHWYLAMAYAQLHNENKTIDTCLAAIKLDPRFAEFYVIIGQIHYDNSRWGQAIPWFELASKCNIPDTAATVIRDNYNWIPHDRLCKCYSEIGEAKKAYDSNEIALKHQPENQRLLFNQEYLRNILFLGRNAIRPIRLSLGSGSKFTPTYKNCDLYPEPNVEELFDQSKVPYKTGTVHSIYSEHALEHAGSHNIALSTLNEWARVLRYGGSLYLKIPDLELCCAAYVDTPDKEITTLNDMFGSKEWYKYTIYGIQDKSGLEFPEGQYHRTGFCKPEIKRLLEKSGFEVQHLENYDGFRTPSIEIKAVQKNKSIKVRWMLSVDTPDVNYASFRIRQFNVHNWMAGNGIDSQLIMGYGEKPNIFDEIRHADIVIFDSFGPIEKILIDKLRRCGISVIHDHCEDLHGLPHQDDCFESASVITCCSTKLAQTASHYGRTVAIPDAFEAPARPKEHNYYKSHGNNGKLRVTWCGMGGNSQNAEAIRPIIEEIGMELRIISEWDNADLKWNLNTWLDDLENTDIVISPQRHWLQPAKSNTKITQPMALGLPVLGSPIDSYKEAIIHGENGFICSTPEEWKKYLIECKNPELREKIGKAAKESVQNYSIDNIGRQWVGLLDTLACENCNPPKVDIIIPTWNNLKYLKECIKSIHKNTDHPYNIIIINSGNDGTSEWIAVNHPNIIQYNSPKRLHFSEANNIGLQISKEAYVCFLNDDTIVSKYWLSALMQEAMKPEIGAVNPFSNCDMGWLHNEQIIINNINLHPGMTLEQVSHIIPDIYEYSHEKTTINRDWVPFFATLIPRKVIDKVGMLDEEYKSGCEDSDYCVGIRNAGYRCVTTFNSFVFHFGGTSRKNSEKVSYETHHAEDAHNHARFLNKHGSSKIEKQIITVSDKKNIGIWTGPAWEEWDINTPTTTGIGGSETCAAYLAKELVKKGNSVTLYGHHQRKKQYGVNLVPWNEFAPSKEIFDLFIISRNLNGLTPEIKAKKVYAWCHDIFYISHIEPNNRLSNFLINKIDKFVSLSPWHSKFLFDYHKNIPKEKITIIPDGFDLERYKGNRNRVKGRMIYSSSPDRGLDVLLDCLPKIRKIVPEAHLHIFYGFFNWESAIRTRNNKHEIAWMERIKSQMNQPGVTYFDRVNQNRLAEEFMQAELWAYPTHFSETFCMTACEAMAAKTPIITSNLAALSTTVGEAGILIDGDSRTEGYQETFVDICSKVLTDKQLWENLSQRGQKVINYDWSVVADQWINL